MELVSVIIPLCNKADYIEETVACVAAQSWPNVEIIIVENNSTDNSYRVAQNHQCKNIKVIQSRNKGASAARNLGLKLAKGTYIQFLDADDLLSPHKIESQVIALSDRYELAFSNWARFTGKFDHQMMISGEIPDQNQTVFQPQEFLEKQYMVPIHSWLCKRSLIERAGKWNENLTVNDDGDFFMRVVDACKSVIYTPEYAYYRSDTTFSLSHSQDPKSYESLYESYIAYKRIVSQYNSPILTRAANEKFGNLFLRSFNHHKEIARLCELELEHNYEYCYPSLRKSSQILSSTFGIKNYLKLKTFLKN